MERNDDASLHIPLAGVPPDVATSPCHSLLCAWGKVSQEYVIAVARNRVVYFVNRRASERFTLRPGSVLDDDWEQLIQKEWTIEEVDLEEEQLYRLYFIRPKLKPSVEANAASAFPAIKTSSPLYQAQLHTARVAAHSVSNTMISGETGSGKEVLARAIHAASNRKDRPFIAVHIASLPRELLASELFGYTDGAFTGAKRGGKIGKLEAANGGTLFLDEIGELTPEMQVVLLRVLEERKITRLGDHEEKPLDIRIIAATNRKLQDEVTAGRFRADLYYRLHVLHVKIPPLRERKEDIPDLVELLLHKLQAQYGRGPLSVCKAAWQLLLSHTWPGNIRELRNVMERAFLLALDESIITISHLPVEWNHSAPIVEATGFRRSSLRDLERETIQRALADAKSISAAAKQLGIARSTLYRKMSEWHGVL